MENSVESVEKWNLGRDYTARIREKLSPDDFVEENGLRGFRWLDVKRFCRSA